MKNEIKDASEFIPKLWKKSTSILIIASMHLAAQMFNASNQCHQSKFIKLKLRK